MPLSRDDAKKHLKRGWPVIANGAQVSRLQDLPSEDAEAKFEATRHEDGNLNRRGLEQAFKEGGTVMIHGRHIESLDDLPDEASLAEGDKQRLEMVQASLDEQLAQLQSQRARLNQSLEVAEQRKQAVESESAETPADTEPAAEEPHRRRGRPRSAETQE